MATNTQIVTEIYESFKTGDVNGAMAPLDDNVEWCCMKNSCTDFGLPWFTGGRGKAGVWSYFSEYIYPKFKVVGFRVNWLISEGDKVVANIDRSMVNKATGRRIDDNLVQVWTFRYGKVVKQEEFSDTYKVMEIYQE